MKTQTTTPTPDQPADCCALGSGVLTPEKAQTYANLFKVLSDPTRLKLLSHIADANCAPLTVSQLTLATGLSQPTISHHLKKLAEVGLLVRRQEGRIVTHTINPAPFSQLRAALELG